MASNFPTSVDATPNVADGADYIEATDVNTAKDSAEAAQTFVGASGASQAHNTDILTQLYEVLPQITLSYTSATTITASAGVVVCKNAAGSIKKLRKNTSTTAITFADIDTGAENSSTNYYVYASADATATTVNFKISTNASTPSGLTSYRIIGGFYNNSSSDISQSTVWSIAGLRIVDLKYAFEHDQVSGTTTLPADDTIPQITEGVSIKTLDFIPKSTTNILVFLCHCNIGGVSGAYGLALFAQGTSNALAATAARGNSTDGVDLNIIHAQAAGSTSKQTYEVRAGNNVAGTVYINGGIAGASGRFFGGVLNSGLLIMEVQ